ncbi:MAG: CHASE2 domain-containing protein, partial [Kiritimatiellia bacterium]|nr:CHASE2 domain-containing protein [Kiritimatiellia bacterium]
MSRRTAAKSASVLAAGIVATFICVALYLWNPPFLQALSRQAHDGLLRWRPTPPQSGAVVLVDIDEESLAAIGQWPWSRVLLAQMTDRLWAAGAAVVVFDMVFPEPDRTSPEQIRELWSRLSGRPVEWSPELNLESFDRQFSDALRRGHSVLGCYMERCLKPAEEVPDIPDGYTGRLFERNMESRALLPQACAVVHSLPILATAASGAFFNTTPDSDRITRRTPLVWAVGPHRLYPSLSLEAVRLFLGLPQIALIYDRKTGTRIREIRLRELSVPVDHNGRLALNFRKESFPTLSAASVIHGTFDATGVAGRIV